MNENVVQVLNQDGTITYEVMEEIEVQTSDDMLSFLEKENKEVLEAGVEIETGSDECMLLDTIHNDLQMLMFIILFTYCSGLIKSGFRAFKKWHRGD